MMELALVQPPNMYAVSQPATYAEAGQMLYSTGEIILDLVEAQPPQQTFAQTLTAQTLKELGRGWTKLFSIMPAEPTEPAPWNARFQWVPGEKLVVAYPEHEISQEACDSIEGFYRAATWRQIMKHSGARQQLPELLGQFEVAYPANLDSGASARMAEAVNELLVELYGMLFEFEGSGAPLIADLDIRWGAAGECLPAMAQAYRASRR